MTDPSDEPDRVPVIDFVAGAVAHRRRFGGGKGQALPRAVGLAKGRTPFVVDATAGLGRDAFLLATLGCAVVMVERARPVHDALATALEAARSADAELAEIVGRIRLIHADARDVLAQLAPDVVLVDPMHPPRRGTALTKQQMRDLRAVVGADPDAFELMQAALATARERVVLKWPQKAAPLTGLRKPSHQILGKSTRYDVFVTPSRVD